MDEKQAMTLKSAEEAAHVASNVAVRSARNARKPAFTNEIARRVCGFLRYGQSMRQIARRPDMPSRMTLLRRMASDAKFASMCAAARNSHQEEVRGMIESLKANAEGKSPRWVRWQVNNHIWRSKKLAPKKYR